MGLRKVKGMKDFEPPERVASLVEHIHFSSETILQSPTSLCRIC